MASWSKQEVEFLKEALQHSMPIEEIADELGRGRRSIDLKIYFMGGRETILGIPKKRKSAYDGTRKPTKKQQELYKAFERIAARHTLFNERNLGKLLVDIGFYEDVPLPTFHGVLNLAIENGLFIVVTEKSEIVPEKRAKPSGHLMRVFRSKPPEIEDFKTVGLVAEKIMQGLKNG